MIDAPQAGDSQTTDPRLAEHRLIWREKPVLREIYSDYYRRMARACRPGATLEIGGGSGNFKEFAPDVVSTDILATPWLDAVADAQALPFSDKSFDNIVLLDVLHHIERPARFFDEACRLLKPNGRIVLIEPGITPVSNFFFTHFHPEPVDMTADPLLEGPLAEGRDAFDANQGIPSLLFGRDKTHFTARFTGLKIIRVQRLSLFAYPLSGGFRKWSLVPAVLVPVLLKVESVLLPLLGPLMGFRLFVVLEKNGN